MAEGYGNHQAITKIFMKGNTKTIKNQVTGSIFGQMDRVMKAILRMIRSTAREL